MSDAQSDPNLVQISTADLTGLTAALEIVGAHADLNERYQKLITESRQTLRAGEIRLTQARGIAKRLMVLVKAAGPNFRDTLPEQARTELDTGLNQANALVFHPEED